MEPPLSDDGRHKPLPHLLPSPGRQHIEMTHSANRRFLHQIRVAVQPTHAYQLSQRISPKQPFTRPIKPIMPIGIAINQPPDKSVAFRFTRPQQRLYLNDG